MTDEAFVTAGVQAARRLYEALAAGDRATLAAIGTWHLPRIVGAARARRMYIENLRLDAARALEWGLVAEVVPADELGQRARSLADRLAAGPTVAYGLQRRLLRDSWGSTLSDHLRAESEAVARSGNTRDAHAAIMAFTERRRPVFDGE